MSDSEDIAVDANKIVAAAQRGSGWGPALSEAEQSIVRTDFRKIYYLMRSNDFRISNTDVTFRNFFRMNDSDFENISSVYIFIGPSCLRFLF